MKSPSPAWILVLGVGILVGTILTVTYLFQWELVPEKGAVKMAYHELVSILLTGIGVILAILALFIATLAIWGYSQFQSMTQKSSAEHLEKMLSGGKFRAEVEDLIIKHVTTQMKSGPLREILEERVDRLLLTGAEERAQSQDSSSEKPKKN